MLLVVFAAGINAQSLLHRIAGEPEEIGDVSMAEGAWYFKLICEHEGAVLHCDQVLNGDHYDDVLLAKKDGEARIFFIQSAKEYAPEGEKAQRMFTIGITRDGNDNYANVISDYKGKLVFSSQLNETEAAESAPWWYIVPVEENSPFITIQNRKTKRMLTLGPLSDGKYALILANEKNANNDDQHWKLRLMAKEFF